ncbi:MAG: tyrosine-type recombinase/integrase [Oscillospiraceae bacterium]|jgi:site-specific recombinase XerD|nr:tyrosine-type recombinase/integrase [Oscillospiraceae bacterium]
METAARSVAVGPETVSEFAKQLVMEERSAATVEKYARYAGKFLKRYGATHGVTRDAVIEWKREVSERYTAAGANGMIAAVNSFVMFLGRPELKVSSIKVQRRVVAESDRQLTDEEAKRLIKAAGRKGNRKMEVAMSAILATGIRVSELRYVTVEAAKRGEAEIRLKGKTRVIFLSDELAAMLMEYAKVNGIESGPLFITRTGRPLDRFSIWRGMKSLCKSARVAAKKVFPHNLRRLFARIFHKNIPNIAQLADVLGHSDVNTTRIYTAVTSDQLRAQISSLPLLL